MPAYLARRGHLSVLVLAGLATTTPALAQASLSLRNSCWTPQALEVKPGENFVRKGDRRFDQPLAEPALADPAPVTAGLRGGVVRRVELPKDKKLIALTFDLCEQPGEVAGYDGAIVDYLRKEHIKATFFAGGKWLRSHEERARQLMAEPLFEIGNHSEAHRNLRGLDGARLRDEILGPQRSYAMIRARLADTQCARAAPEGMGTIAPLPSLFRFPYGACNPTALAAVNDLGLVAIQWDLSTGDPAPAESAHAIAQAMLHARAGSIILAHANGRGWHTAAALPLALPQLRAKGFEFVTVSELLAAGHPVVEQKCYDSRPGDTDRYDFLVAHRAHPSDGWNTTIHQ